MIEAGARDVGNVILCDLARLAAQYVALVACVSAYPIVIMLLKNVCGFFIIAYRLHEAPTSE